MTLQFHQITHYLPKQHTFTENRKNTSLGAVGALAHCMTVYTDEGGGDIPT